jgi:drug/metabolite transporter (DMT)-like permease
MDNYFNKCYILGSERIEMKSKPIVFASAGMLFYALQNVIIEQKLAKYHVLSLLLYFYLAMLPLALAGLGYLKITHQPILAPTGNAILIALAVGAMFFVADLFYIGAYSAKGTLVTITTISILFPAVASIIKYVWVGGLPNRYQMIGYALAVLAVLCVTKGSVAKTP